MGLDDLVGLIPEGTFSDGDFVAVRTPAEPDQERIARALGSSVHYPAARIKTSKIVRHARAGGAGDWPLDMHVYEA